MHTHVHTLLTQTDFHFELVLLASQLSLHSVVKPQARVAREQQATDSVYDGVVSHLSSKITLATRSAAFCCPVFVLVSLSSIVVFLLHTLCNCSLLDIKDSGEAGW